MLQPSEVYSTDSAEPRNDTCDDAQVLAEVKVQKCEKMKGSSSVYSAIDSSIKAAYAPPTCQVSMHTRRRPLQFVTRPVIS